jgi:hypothetical protein
MDQAPLLREKLVPAKFTKRSSRKISQNGAPAKPYSTKIPNQIYQPASASNLLILAKLPVNRWDATLEETHLAIISVPGTIFLLTGQREAATLAAEEVSGSGGKLLNWV